MNYRHALSKILFSGMLVFSVMMAVFWLSCTPIQSYLNPEGPKWKGNFANPIPPPEKTLKVVTFNIQYAQKIDHAVYELRELAELRDADIILLQEMDVEGTERIAKTLHYNYVYYPASLHTHHDRPFGNAILSKWPLSEEAKIILPYEHPVNKQRRIAVSATITIGTKPIKVYNLHAETLLLREAKRREQIQTIVDHISAQEPPTFFIVGGDFNTAREKDVEAVTNIFKEAGFECATEHVGSTTKTFLTLDHIYARGMRVIDAGKVKETRASDHFPVWAILERQ